ncbi:MAG: hypothetical protein RJA63_2103, partial [Pseudomonadota bacterium]
MLRIAIALLCLAFPFLLRAAGPEVEIRRISSVDTYGTSFLVKSPAGIQVVMDPYLVIEGLKADV